LKVLSTSGNKEERLSRFNSADVMLFKSSLPHVGAFNLFAFWGFNPQDDLIDAPLLSFLVTKFGSYTKIYALSLSVNSLSASLKLSFVLLLLRLCFNTVGIDVPFGTGSNTSLRFVSSTMIPC
jgi:hypothetical protein